MQLAKRIEHKLKNAINYFIVLKYNYFNRPLMKLFFSKKKLSNKPNSTFKYKFSDVERDIEIKENDQNLKEVVFACYFTKRLDPQSGVLRSIPDIEYIRPWYDSIKKLDIDGIIIHDGIDSDFIKTFQTDKIQFRKYTAGNYAIFDERWILYYLFISRTNISFAFFTDISDVFIKANPFITFQDKDMLYIGRDNANKIRLSEWMMNEIKTFSKESGHSIPKSFKFQELYNVGIVGGERNLILFFLSKVINFFLLTNSEPYKEMTVFNLVIHKYFFPKLHYSPNEPILTNTKKEQHRKNKHLYSGFPLNSGFKDFDMESKAVFIHK